MGFRVRLQWQNPSDHSQRVVLREKRFTDPSAVHAWAQSVFESHRRSAPEGWMPLVEVLDPVRDDPVTDPVRDDPVTTEG